ncbi:hypothetical protein DFS34DRAFT_606505 [Phlyctochytrium arcticum]|nr:hypothetical protein DFS34DRAFT_606505 [Phlyctochytrium arcticum]
MGTVVNIFYENGSCPPRLPTAVMVSFDRYDGPTLTSVTGKSVVPITPICREFEYNNNQYSRTQLPLILAWA